MFGIKVVNELISSNSVKALGFVTTVLISRYLGAEMLGKITYLLSILALMSMFNDLGFNNAYIKRVAAKENTPSINSTYLIIKTVMLIIFMTVASTYFLYLKFINSQQVDGYLLSLIHI